MPLYGPFKACNLFVHSCGVYSLYTLLALLSVSDFTNIFDLFYSHLSNNSAVCVPQSMCFVVQVSCSHLNSCLFYSQHCQNQSRCHARVLALTAAVTSFSCHLFIFVMRSSGFIPVDHSNQPRNVKRCSQTKQK